MSTKPADALVVFGITGDLERKMTLRSLYRLEQRGLLPSREKHQNGAEWIFWAQEAPPRR